MLKKIILTILISSFFGINYSNANTLIERTIDWYKAKIIEYNTDSKNYDIKIWVHPKDWGSLRSIMNWVWWITWVNWVFECPKDYASCWWKTYTINERYVNWEKRWVYKSTWDRVVFWWDKNIKPFLFQTDKINKGKEKNIFEWFANHPLLLKDWISQTYIYHEKGLIDYKMKAKATKNFICSNKKGNKIFFGLVYGIDIDALANTLKIIWCYNAINLDAGYSTSFIYNGKYITGPKREILDWVFIVPKNIDTLKIDKKAKNTMTVLLDKISDKDINQKIKELEKLNNLLNKLSINFYNNHKENVIENIRNYDYILVFEWISKNSKMKKLVKTDKFRKAESLVIKWDSIYRKKMKSSIKKIVWTKIKIENISSIREIYEINLLRTYTKELISFHNKIKKIDSSKYLKESGVNLDVKIDIKLK